MSQISETFKKLREKSEAAFMPFLTLGFPNIKECFDLIKTMSQSGADLIELGVPFSDPLADGPTIQEASQIALKNGMTVKKAIEIVKQLRSEGVSTPILLMGYANPFLAYGIENLARDLKAAKVDGLIIPDLPPNDSEEWLKYLSPQEIDLIFFLSPTTSKERMQTIIDKASGFIYGISVTGVTGARERLPDTIKTFIEDIKERTETPLCIGFGLSKADHIKEVSQIADGAIMASSIINTLAQTSAENRNETLSKLIKEMKNATKRT
ncbi:MAG: tryptophan synthase subunit alpha [Bdellovibrionota bacterium]